MGFSKAKPQQARLKVSVYGPPGSGKTFSTLLMAEGLAKVRGGRIAYVDTERGTDFYAQAVKTRGAHPAAFDFDALYTKSIADVTESVKALDPKVHSVIVVDSISHLWQAAIDAYEGRLTGADTIPMHAWGKLKKPYKDLINWLIGSPFDVFILGRQKNVFEEDDDGRVRSAGVAMRAEGETAYEPHICVRMESATDKKDTTRSTYLMHVEKDRSGVLSGRTFANPDFGVIEPLLPLLGDEQAPAEDEDERIAKDGELLDKQAAKAAEKAAKSKPLFDDFAAGIRGCTSIEELGGVSREIKKKTRSMTPDHVEALRVLFSSKKDTLEETEVGAF